MAWFNFKRKNETTQKKNNVNSYKKKNNVSNEDRILFSNAARAASYNARKLGMSSDDEYHLAMQYLDRAEKDKKFRNRLLNLDL